MLAMIKCNKDSVEQFRAKFSWSSCKPPNAWVERNCTQSNKWSSKYSKYVTRQVCDLMCVPPRKDCPIQKECPKCPVCPTTGTVDASDFQIYKFRKLRASLTTVKDLKDAINKCGDKCSGFSIYKSATRFTTGYRYYASFYNKAFTSQTKDTTGHGGYTTYIKKDFKMPVTKQPITKPSPSNAKSNVRFYDRNIRDQMSMYIDTDFNTPTLNFSNAYGQAILKGAATKGLACKDNKETVLQNSRNATYRTQNCIDLSRTKPSELSDEVNYLVVTQADRSRLPRYIELSKPKVSNMPPHMKIKHAENMNWNDRKDMYVYNTPMTNIKPMVHIYDESNYKGDNTKVSRFGIIKHKANSMRVLKPDNNRVVITKT